MNQIPNQKDAYRLLHQGILAFSRAEQQGICIDMEYCQRTETELTSRVKELESEFYGTKFYRHWKHSIGGKKPNINSNAQLSRLLYKVKKLKPVKSTVTGQGSTDEEALESLGIPEIKTLLQIRKLKKLRDTYLRGFLKEQVNGIMHPNFNLHIAKTYRSSSDRPNFQNIPKRDKEAQEICRRAIKPRPGHQLLEVDYSGIEVAISACYNQDPELIRYIKDPTTDMHGDMAKQIFFLDAYDKTNPSHKTLRGAAKNGFVFPEFYGDYYGNCAVSLACTWGGLPTDRWGKGQGIDIGSFIPLYLSDHLRANGIKSLGDFTDHIQKIEEHFWGRRFREYALWKQRQWKEYQKNGYIDMLTGFRCWGPMRRNETSNYPIQGSAFHCLLWAFIELDKIIRRRKMKTRLIGQIHDAVVADVHPDELHEFCDLLQEVMIEALMKAWEWIIVPLSIEIDVSEVDGNWFEMSPYKKVE